MRRCILGLMFLATNVLAQSLVLKIVKLHYVQAEQVKELIRPLMSAREEMSGSEQIFILKVMPQTLTNIRTILHQIDVPPNL